MKSQTDIIKIIWKNFIKSKVPDVLIMNVI